MKALSVRQPFALLIVAGIKDIENRSWPTKYRGRILIHAAKKVDTEAMKKFDMLQYMTDAINHYRGGIIGEVEIVDCVEESNSPWFENGCYGFVLKNAKKREFIPLRGKLGIFDVDIV